MRQRAGVDLNVESERQVASAHGGRLRPSPVRPGDWALLTERDAAQVQRFYLSLSPSERQMRFRGAASDDAIRRYCAGIDWPLTIIAAGGLAAGMRAMVQVRATARGWGRAVVTLAWADRAGAGAGEPEGAAERARMLAHLVQLGIFAAGRRGCNRFALRLDALSWDVMPQLAGMAPGEIGEQLAQVVLAGAGAWPADRDAAPSRDARLSLPV